MTNTLKRLILIIILITTIPINCLKSNKELEFIRMQLSKNRNKDKLNHYLKGNLNEKKF